MVHLPDLHHSTIRLTRHNAFFLAIITLVTFGFAITAVPVSGPYCPGDCIEYPFLDSLKQYPKDYIWMYLAMIMLLSYQVFMVCDYVSFHFITDKFIAELFHMIC